MRLSRLSEMAISPEYFVIPSWYRSTKDSDAVVQSLRSSDPIAAVPVTKPACRKAEVASLLRFANGLHLVNRRIVIEVELDTAQAARRLRRDRLPAQHRAVAAKDDAAVEGAHRYVEREGLGEAHVVGDVPALRERREDIPLLTRHFLQKSARELGVEAQVEFLGLVLEVAAEDVEDRVAPDVVRNARDRLDQHLDALDVHRRAGEVVAGRTGGLGLELLDFLFQLAIALDQRGQRLDGIDLQLVGQFHGRSSGERDVQSIVPPGGKII